MDSNLQNYNTLHNTNRSKKWLEIFNKIKIYIHHLLWKKSIECKVLWTQEKLLAHISDYCYDKTTSNLLPEELKAICRKEKHITGSWLFSSKNNIPYSTLEKISLHPFISLDPNAYYSLEPFSISLELEEEEIAALFEASSFMTKYQFDEKEDMILSIQNQLLWLGKDNVVYKIRKPIDRDIPTTVYADLFFLVKQCSPWLQKSYDGFNVRPVVAWGNIQELYRSNYGRIE
jgi:squalene cyclase